MCKKDYNTIIQDIDNHIKNSGRRYYSDFYVGISNDAERRLFNEHHVKRDGSWWIYRTAEDAKIARDVEQYYMKRGMRGDSGGGNIDSNMVYCYAIEPTTTE